MLIKIFTGTYGGWGDPVFFIRIDWGSKPPCITTHARKNWDGIHQG